MKKNTIKLFIFIFLSLFFYQACTGTKDFFKGKIAAPDQIHTIADGNTSGIWKTKELSVNYLYTSSPPDHFNLTGYLSISEHITNTFHKIGWLFLFVSFLDNDGRVIYTDTIHPRYTAYEIPPQKIPFNLNSTLPAEAVSFCFSYSGEFQGDLDMSNLYIRQTPFR